jgi:hypothetical protein
MVIPFWLVEQVKKVEGSYVIEFQILNRKLPIAQWRSLHTLTCTFLMKFYWCWLFSGQGLQMKMSYLAKSGAMEFCTLSLTNKQINNKYIFVWWVHVSGQWLCRSNQWCCGGCKYCLLTFLHFCTSIYPPITETFIENMILYSPNCFFNHCLTDSSDMPQSIM